jgi:O-acetyl-ADP-ribose deacetylase (regulator of RNase III)
MKADIVHCSIEVKKGDITEEPVEAIVNPANIHLHHGGGVAEAIIRKGGYTIQQESNEIGHCPVGEAVVTGAGKLPCKFVIHTVGPMMGEKYEEMKLRMATRNCLIRAEELGLRSIAFPAVSTGIFGYPLDECARVMLSETVSFIHGHPDMAIRVVYCLYDDEALEIFEKELATYSENT